MEACFGLLSLREVSPARQMPSRVYGLTCLFRPYPAQRTQQRPMRCRAFRSSNISVARRLHNVPVGQKSSMLCPSNAYLNESTKSPTSSFSVYTDAHGALHNCGESSAPGIPVPSSSPFLFPSLVVLSSSKPVTPGKKFSLNYYA